jgi:hypothetical protein
MSDPMAISRRLVAVFAVTHQISAGPADTLGNSLRKRASDVRSLR